MNITTARRTTSTSGARRAILAGLLALIAVSALSLISARPASASTVREWKGAGADGNWTNPANWVGGAPVAGDQLVFGETGARRTNINNFPVDTSFDSIIFHGTGYNLTGNRVRLTDGLFTYHDTPLALTNTVTLAIRVPELLYFKAGAADHTVTYKGGFVLNADATFEGVGNQIVTGPITGAGAVIGAAGSPGRLTLAGTSTTTGPTKVLGKVVVTGSYPGRPVSVAGGTLEGSGTTGPVSAPDAMIIPGFPVNSAGHKAGVLKVMGDLTMSMVGNYAVIVNGSAAGNYSQLVVSGAVRLTDSPFGVYVTRTSPITVGQVMVIIKNNGPAAVSGTFRDLPEGSTTYNRYNPSNIYRVSYKGGPSGRDITLTVLTTG